MGRTLGRLWAELGHDVFFGARDAKQARDAAAGSPHGDNDAAARHGEVVLWSPRDVDPREVLRDPALLDGKIVLDPNNGPVPPDFVGGTPGGDPRREYALGPVRGELSLAERLARALPGAHVVKAFNTMAQEVFEHAPNPTSVSVFLAGENGQAKEVAAQLAKQMGLVPVDAGPLAAARMVEGLADAIRVMMGSLGVYATISVNVLPAPPTKRLGERTPTRLA